jgi:hypothetical protein
MRPFDRGQPSGIFIFSDTSLRGCISPTTFGVAWQRLQRAVLSRVIRVKVFSCEAVDGPVVGVDAADVVRLQGPVTEVAEGHPPGEDLHLLPLLRADGVAEGAGPLVAGVRRAPLENVAVALPAELLPVAIALDVLGAGEAPQQGGAGVGGMNAVAGGADHTPFHAG